MSMAEEIEKLGALRAAGTLTEDEFVRAKAHILDAAANAANDANAASGAGAAPGSGAGNIVRPLESFLHRFYRSRSDQMLAGVCGGLGKVTDLPSWAWRVVFSLSFLWFGIGLLFYVLLWMFVPLEP